MLNVDTALLERLSLLSSVTHFQAGPELVDHPSGWLDILGVLPCVDAGNMCATAEFANGARIAVAVREVFEPVVLVESVSATRRFVLSFADDNFVCSAVSEFSVAATADQLDFQLELISAEDLFEDVPEFAATLALALPALLSRATRDVVAVVHRALSADLSDTAVHLTLVVPNAAYAAILTHSATEMASLSSELADAGASFVPTIRLALADAPIAVGPKKAQAARVELDTAQRLALALNLVTLREARGLKQLEVAHQALGFSKSHAAVSRLERGILTDVEAERLEKLATFFDTDVSALLANKLTGGEPTQPGEGEGLSIFDGECDFTPSINYGKRLTLARTSAGLSVLALSKKLGHGNDSTVQGWEDEKSSPRRNSFIDLGLALSAPVSWLMFGRRVDTPSRGLALRLTAMQKLYGLTNGEVGALFETSNDSAALESAGKMVSRLSRAAHGPSQETVQRLATAFQVPADWISPPTVEDLRNREQTLKVKAVQSATAAAHSKLSHSARKLVSDLIDLIEMGLISDADVRTLRGDMLDRFTTPVISPRKYAAARAAAVA